MAKYQYNLTIKSNPLFLEHKPHTFNQASKFNEWQKTMSDEINALSTTNTWTLVPKPLNANIVGKSGFIRSKEDKIAL